MFKPFLKMGSFCTNRDTMVCDSMLTVHPGEHFWDGSDKVDIELKHMTEVVGIALCAATPNDACARGKAEIIRRMRPHLIALLDCEQQMLCRYVSTSCFLLHSLGRCFTTCNSFP
jgi:hypothetical protein